MWPSSAKGHISKLKAGTFCFENVNMRCSGSSKASSHIHKIFCNLKSLSNKTGPKTIHSEKRLLLRKLIFIIQFEAKKIIFARLSKTRAYVLPFIHRGRQPQNALPSVTGIRILNKFSLTQSVYYHLPRKKCLSLRPLLFPVQLRSQISGNEKLSKHPQHHVF